jgi:hypothetical protein
MLGQVQAKLVFILWQMGLCYCAKAQDTGRKPIPMRPAMTENWQPVKKMDVDKATGIPADAVVLFDGRNLSAWCQADGSAAKWKVINNELVVNAGMGNIFTTQPFEDIQLHLEWNVPQETYDNPMKRGNSGILLQGLYEVQILDSYSNPTYSNGIAGSIYKQAAPLVNVTRPPGEWNVFDIVYTAPRFKEDGSLFTPARITLLHNGVLVLNNKDINGATVYTGLPEYKPHVKASLQLQDHGSPVRYRNIWLRPL